MNHEQVIRDLLRVQLNTVSGAFPTAFENMPFMPQVGTPWQWVTLLWAQTENPTFGDGFMREIGIYQVTLNFPKSEGPDSLFAQASIIRAGFVRGLTLSSGQVQVKILRTPFFSPPIPSESAWYSVAVSVPFVADVQPDGGNTV